VEMSVADSSAIGALFACPTTVLQRISESHGQGDAAY